jgi:hypothetical protein
MTTLLWYLDGLLAIAVVACCGLWTEDYFLGLVYVYRRKKRKLSVL